MTLFNNEVNQNDLITDLPSNVIDDILANLEIEDLVRTSILSKNWRYMWTSAPHLCFDEYFVERFPHHDDVYKIIMHFLMMHNGPIHKFSIDVCKSLEFVISMEKLNTWIPFMSKNIKHLELVTFTTPGDECQMPDILFSCKELTFLKFSTFNLSVPPDFCGFKKLLELHLNCIELKSSVLESFMSGCPFLENLTIEYCTGCDYLVISSPTLKVLVLELVDTMSICLKKADNLIDFTVEVEAESEYFIKSLPKIKRLSLSGYEKYGDTIPAMLLTSSFSSLENLRLIGVNLKERGELLCIVNILKSAPRLVELIIQIYNDVDTTQMIDYLEELECSCCCPKLQTVNIYFGACSHQHTLSLIKFILANSPSLKDLTFSLNFHNRLDAVELLKISHDLLWMKRASPGAQVDFRQFTYR